MSSNMDWLYRARQKREEEKSNSTGSEDWLERARKKREAEKKNANPEAVSNTIANNVNNWLKNHNAYVFDYQQRYSNRTGTSDDAYVSDSKNWLDNVSKQRNSLYTEADNILSYMDEYSDYLDADWMDNVRKTITGAKYNQKLIYDSAVSDNQWWSSFQDEEDYNFWRDHDTVESRQKWYAEQQDKLAQLQSEKDKDDDFVSKRAEELYQTGKYTSMLHATEAALEEYNKEVATIESNMRNYERGNYNERGQHFGSKVVDDYSAYIKEPDFNAVSSTHSVTNPTRADLDEYDILNDSSTWDYDEKGILRDAKGNEIRQDASGKFVNPKANDYAVKDRLGIYLGATDEEREEYAGTIVNGTWGDIIGQGIEGSWDQLEEDEIKIYYYLLNTEGKESADKYLDDMKTELNRREAMDQAEEIAKEYRSSNSLGKVAMNAATVPAQLLGGITSTADNLSHMVRGQDINPYSSAHSLSNYSNIVRSETAKELDATGVKIPVLDFTLGDAYQSGMSMLDSFAAIGIGGNLGGVLLATNAASSEATRLYEQGASKEQIALGAAAAGAAEMVFEKLSIDNLINMKDAKTVGQIVKNALVQGGVEASEEGFTEIANILTNSIIMGDKSDWNKLVEKYNGDTFSAFMEKVKDVVNASLSGFISGVGSSAGPSTVSYVANKLQQNADAKQRYGDNQAGFVEESLMIDADNAYAKKLQSKLQDGKDLSGRQLRKLEEKNASTLKKRLASSVQETAKKRLTDLGEKENVDNVAKLVSKLVVGEEMTRSERSTLARSQFGSKVAKDIKENGLEYESPATYKSLEDRVGTESKFNVSKSGQATIQESGEAFDIKKAEVVSFTTDKATGKVVDVTFKTEGGTEVQASGIDFEDDDQSHLVEAVSNIENITPKDAQAIIRDYDPSSGQTVSEYLNGMDEGFTYGYHGYSVEDLKAGNFAPKLSSTQMMSAYELGKAARRESTTASDAPKVKMRTAAEAKLTAEQKLAQQKASIESDDVEVYFQDGATITKFDDKKVKDKHTGIRYEMRMSAVNTARFLSKLKIGGKYYFFESYVNKAGDRVYKDSDGNEVAAPNGMFKDSDGSIHIDLNAGDAGNGIALFTLGHELTHFIKAQSKSQFKILCDLVKEAFDKTELSMRERVLEKQKFLKDVRGEDVSYDEAYEEVVADAMSTMITDGNFHEKLMEIRVKDKGLFNTIKRFFDNMIAEFKKVYEKLTPDQKDARDIREVKDMFDKIQTAFAEALVEASDNFQAAMESVAEENAEAISADETITDGAVVTDGNGERLSIRSMKHDIAEGKMFEDLKSVCGWTDSQVSTLRTQLKGLVEYMIPYRDILDMNESYGMEGRRFSPYKPNSDPLYKISMDFSTLCSKRLLTQYVIEQLQLRENRPMSAEEQMAIRDMLNEYRKVEKGLQVACAMCYVEAARLKSPKQIQRWLDDPTPHLINYFALKNTEFNASVKKAQADFKESKGYDRNAPKKDMKQSDVTALNKIGPKMRSQYQPSEAELAIIEKAKTLPNETYLTAGNLADLSEKESVIYDAYTSFVRTATRSKSLESDEPYYYGDSTRDNGNGIIVTDSFIEAVNRENGMRFSSWSDWRIQHLLDYITAVIDNSVRGAAMHGYTKFGDEVRVLGKTGMMFNMSGVAGTQNGLNEDGSLNFSPTESIDVNEAIQLRDEYPDTAGLQCIGVSNDHIIALLRSDIIDYVIPYHVSGLNAALRRMADIHGWQDYTSTQHATIDKSSKLDDAVDKEHWHEEPVFSEFFVGYDTGMTGIEAMKASAEKYKQMCKDRGLKPKFEQFATEDNYWKLLIDRKMINQQTGKLIRQNAVTPTFDFDTIKGVVDKFVDNYDAGLEARALNHIVENWDSIPQRIKDLKKQGGTTAKKTKKTTATLANQTVAAQPKDGGKHSEKKSERASNEELAQADDTALYIKNTDKSNYIGMIFNGAKTEETRSRRTLDAFIGKDFYVTDGKYVYGSIVLGEPHKYTEEEFHKKKNQLKHRVPVGDEYDIKPGGTKWAYPIESYKKFDKPKKLSDSTEYKNSFQARQVKFSDRGAAKRDKTPFPWEDADNDVEEDIYSYAARGELENFKGDYKADPQELMFLQMKNELANENKRKAEEVAKKNQRNTYDQKLKDVSYASTYSPDVMKAVSAFRDAWQEFSGDDITELYSYKNGEVFENFDRVFMATSFHLFAYRYNRNANKKLENGTDEYNELGRLFNRAVHRVEEFYSGLSSKQKGEAYWHSVSGRDGKNKISYSERGEGSSNRSLLANAFEGIVRDSVEYKQIQKYKANVDTLNVLERQLSDINEEIRLETDAKKRAILQEKAERIANDINKQDKVLLNLEASEPLRKVIERERKKEAQNVKEHVNEIEQNKKLRAEQTELRHKIRKTIRDLDKILNRGNKNRNVKEDLQPVVTKALQAAEILFTENYGNYDMLRNGIGADLSDAEEALVATCTRMLRELDKMPTDGYDNFMARQEAENRLKSKMYNLKDVFARERKRLNNTKVSSILGELADAYASLEESDQSYVQGAYSEPVHTFLKNLQNEVGGTIVHDMTKDQLESVYAAYKMVLTTVRKANQLFNDNIKMSREQIGNAVIKEVLKAGGVHLLGTKMGDAISQADWNNMKPIWVANRIGSESFAKLMQGLFEGQYNFAVDINEVKQFKLSMDKKYNPRNWDAEKLYQFESSTGKEFNLNLQQIMSLYAFSKREQAYSHLLNGGFVFEDNSTVVVDGKLGIKKTYIHKGATSYKLNEDTLNSIINSLTDEQKAYVDEMQKYLSDVMGAKGNEVSMQLYGIKMFNEEFYFPLRSSGAYMERAKEAELKKQQGQINLVNSGFTHSVKPQAKNPIILSDFMDVWAEHCNEMSMYHSMVLPMEDFRKVYNYSTIHDEQSDSASVQQTIQDAYGDAATKYIDQLYKELNAGATVDPRETPWKKLISNFKKTAVMLSGSVVVQQFSSIGRSFAIIDPKYFVGAKVNSDTKLSAVEEMKKYAPVAIIKEMGGFDTGTKGNAKSYIMSEHYEKGERISGLLKDEQYRGDIMGFLPAWADEKTWCAIWEAAKRETKANNSDMNVKSEEFLKLAGERFSEVIEKTQVYDSVLARSANMRSKGNFMAMATAFMAEPTTTVNLLEDAIRRGNKKYIARAFGSVAVAIVLNNALASLVYAMRDDDEDETFIEKYFQSFTSGMIDDINPMTYYPFLKDVYSLFQGYDVERTDMSVIADLRDALKKTISVIGKDTSNMDDDKLAEHYKTVNSAILSLLDAGCSVFGVPIKNVRREANGIINAWNTISKDLSGERNATWRGFWDNVGSAVKDTVPIYAWTKDKSKQDKLYEAIISGDKTYVSRLKAGYKDDAAYNSAVRKALRENDPRIHEAAQARYNGNIAECKRIFNEIKNEGKFNSNDILEAINSEESKIRNEGKSETVSSSYSSTDFVNAVIVGDTRLAATMKDDIISAKVANGKSQEEAEESFTTSVSSATRDAFDSSLLDEAGAKKMLREYADMGEDEAASKVTYWSVAKAYPQYRDDLSEARVEKYNEFAKPAGITLDVFVRYLRGTSGIETKYDKWGDVEESVRDQVLAVIDSLPITWEQKDALYLAAGYAESKIWDVPW